MKTTVTTSSDEVGHVLSDAEHLISKWLSRLVQFNTSNPPGSERDAQIWLAQEFSKLGLVVDHWDVLPDRPNTVAKWSGGAEGRSLILNGHVDVAEVTQPHAWKHSPFGGDIDGGMVYGRGSSDMKAGLAGFFFALWALKELGFEPAGDIVVQSVMGEERGEPGTRACLERGYRADFAIVGEDTNMAAVANIGSIIACIEIHTSEALHVNQRVRYLHAGGQLQGANVLEKAALKILPALNDLERQWANEHNHPLFPPGQEMIAPFLLSGGGNPFITPDACSLYVSVFYLPGHSKEDVCREVEEHVRRTAAADLWLRQHPPTVVWGPSGFTAETLPSDFDPDSPALRLLRSCHSQVVESEMGVGPIGFASDVGWLYAAGIPSVCYGPGNPSIAHGTDEHIPIQRVIQYAAVLSMFIAEWTRSGVE